MNTAAADITGIGGTGVIIVASEWGSRETGALGASIVHGAGIAIFAGSVLLMFSQPMLGLQVSLVHGLSLQVMTVVPAYCPPIH